jgi:GNAT superfamily N-acetyltransferase
MSTLQAINRSIAINNSESLVSVEPALEEHAPVTWAIYKIGRIAAQTNPAIGLSREVMESSFSEPKSGLFGTSALDWLQAIRDTSGQQTVLNAWVRTRFSGPVGIARPCIDENERWLRNVYVAEEARDLGVFRGLLKATIDWHQGNPFKLKVADYNDHARAVYEHFGFGYTGVQTTYSISKIPVRQLEMIHPGV